MGIKEGANVGPRDPISRGLGDIHACSPELAVLLNLLRLSRSGPVDLADLGRRLKRARDEADAPSSDRDLLRTLSCDGLVALPDLGRRLKRTLAEVKPIGFLAEDGTLTSKGVAAIVDLERSIEARTIVLESAAAAIVAGTSWRSFSRNRHPERHLTKDEVDKLKANF